MGLGKQPGDLAQTPVPCLTSSLQSWGSSGLCWETQVCFRPLVLLSTPLLPYNLALGQSGSPRL